MEINLDNAIVASARRSIRLEFGAPRFNRNDDILRELHSAFIAQSKVEIEGRLYYVTRFCVGFPLSSAEFIEA